MSTTSPSIGGPDSADGQVDATSQDATTSAELEKSKNNLLSSKDTEQTKESQLESKTKQNVPTTDNQPQQSKKSAKEPNSVADSHTISTNTVKTSVSASVSTELNPIENTQAPNSPSASSSTSLSNLSLSERFAYACREVPPPSWSPSTNEKATPVQRQYLVENSSGILLLSPNASKQPCEAAREAARLAIAAAAAPKTSQPLQSPFRQSSEIDTKRTTKLKLPSLSEIPPTMYKPLKTFQWEGSTAQSLLEQFQQQVLEKMKANNTEENAETGTDDSAANLKAKSKTMHENKKLDPVVWAAQEASAGVSLLREIRAICRAKKPTPRSPLDGSVMWSLLASKEGRLKPEAAAEMARARVAAAAAAKVMRESEQADNVSQQSPPQFSNYNHDSEDLLLRGCFRRTLSLDSTPTRKERKRVAFAPGTVFDKKRNVQS